MGSDVHLNLLDRVRIASPCTMRWDDMPGNDKTRHCSACNLNVHNFSAMTRHEAEALLRTKGNGRMCGFFYRRPDGTVLTRDCPVGISAARARVHTAIARIAAALGLAVAGAAGATASAKTRTGETLRLRALQPFAAIVEWLLPAPPPPPPPLPPPLAAPGGICILPTMPPQAPGELSFRSFTAPQRAGGSAQGSNPSLAGPDALVRPPAPSSDDADQRP